MNHPTPQQLATTPLDQIILFDTETTGLGPADEILSIAICDGTGRILLDTLVRPTRHDTWPQAERIHHISPDKVAGQPTIDHIAPTILGHLSTAAIISGYNTTFDLRMLAQSLHDPTLDRILDHTPIHDCMTDYARIHGERDPRHDDYKWQKLAVAAAHYGYTFHAHDAAEDIKATAHVYRHLTGHAN